MTLILLGLWPSQRRQKCSAQQKLHSTDEITKNASWLLVHKHLRRGVAQQKLCSTDKIAKMRMRCRDDDLTP